MSDPELVSIEARPITAVPVDDILLQAKELLENPVGPYESNSDDDNRGRAHLLTQFLTGEISHMQANPRSARPSSARYVDALDNLLTQLATRGTTSTEVEGRMRADITRLTCSVEEKKVEIRRERRGIQDQVYNGTTKFHVLSDVITTAPVT